MLDREIEAMIANTFLEMADALGTEQYGKKPVISFASEGNERSQDNIEEAMKVAEMKGLKAVLTEGEDPHKKVEEMLDSGEIDGVVIMHYPLPVGVSTVGEIVTLSKGKPMYTVTTAGTSDTDRISGMVKNTIYGIIVAKVDGMENPTVGIANIDDVHQTEKALLKLAENGYGVNFAGSVRTDGGTVMRGNDLLEGTPDIMVMDSLTGDLMIEVFSSYTTGGNYESLGLGHGPGVGGGYDRLIMIVLCASDAPVITGAMGYTTNLIHHDWKKIANEEFEKASKVGLKDIINELKPADKKDAGVAAEEVKMLPKEVVTSQIPGIEVMDLEDAVKVLQKTGIYVGGGMGRTGSIALTSDANKDKVHRILKVAGYVS